MTEDEKTIPENPICMKVGYIRISNPEKQDPMSQRKLMNDLGVPQDRIFEDFGSGSIEPLKRTAYRQMVAFLGEHPDINEIVMSEYSRLGRTVQESLYQLLELNRRGIKITSLSAVEQAINNIPATWQPAVISCMMGAAQTERAHIQERTRWGLAAARARGKKLGRPSVKVDFGKVEEIMKKYNLREAPAIRVAGYKASTYYAQKKQRTGGKGLNN